MSTTHAFSLRRRTPVTRLAQFAVLLAGTGAAACAHRRHVPTPESDSVTRVTGVGFNQPENLVYDSASDVFLVSNMGGGGSTRDNNGFVSRVGPDGRVLALRWIAGGVNGATLDAPKGLAIHGDTLLVADLGGVHRFDRRTGAVLGDIPLPGLVMNDVAVAADGAVWITDTGPGRTTTPIDTTHDLDAVWRVGPDGRVVAAARGLALDRPDGLVLDGDGALIATFGANRIERVRMPAASAGTPAGAEPVMTMPGGRVDGLRRLPDGGLVVSSWDAKTVWRLAPGPLPDPAPRALLTGVTSPAGLAIDTRRGRLAVTSMQDNALYLLPLR